MAELAAERGGDPTRPGKKDPLDVLVWRSERPGEPAWESRFGSGRPGWHVECAAIAAEYLGVAFDVQAGGSDLVFPHHEMSASHARVALGPDEQVFARLYAHAGMVSYQGQKMSKSLGNLVFVNRLLADGVDPMAIRMALLAHHYTSDWEWTDEALTEAESRLGRWRAAVDRPAEAVGLAEAVAADGAAGAEVLAEIRAAMQDDLDAPRALEAVDRWASGSDTSAADVVRQAVDALLGIRL
jgi:L-cysteine:1D-myo-inositol 2-amino-2-deoxy-alpha-D-glucopyranoside ligase